MGLLQGILQPIFKQQQTIKTRRARHNQGPI
jgi:hypothetical protein